MDDVTLSALYQESGDGSCYTALRANRGKRGVQGSQVKQVSEARKVVMLNAIRNGAITIQEAGIICVSV